MKCVDLQSRSILRYALFVSGILASALVTSTASAFCIVDVLGKWQQTHVMIQGNKIGDDTQVWVFKPDRTVQFTKSKPAFSVPGTYQCEGNTIYITGRLTNQFKVIEHGLDTMTWESGAGGTVFVKRTGK